ncbi:MAG: hypothetical protein EBU90_08105 [Proteobacteria bacterium]|nr:hypothetical protein [Pseudomonadota bacterium]
MNEYKNPIKKMWQQANQPIQDGNNVQLPHTLGTAAPTTTPAKVGLLFIDTTSAKVYVSTGITASTDWKALN